MAAVVFAFGSRPGLNEHQALDVAELLARRRFPASVSAASKIRGQAERSVDRSETSEDVELTTDELSELVALLQEPRWPEEQPAFAHLRDEARLASVPRRSLHTFVLVLEDGTLATPPRFISTEPGWQAGDEIVVGDRFFDVVEGVRHVDRGVYATLIVRPK
jgi:hypothetical protein